MTGMQRLTILRNFLRDNAEKLMSDNSFNLEIWGVYSQPPCGFSGCAVGWGANISELKKEGLTLRKLCWDFVEPAYNGSRGVSAVRSFFNLPSELITFMFLEHYYEDNGYIPVVVKHIDVVLHMLYFGVFTPKPGIVIEKLYRNNEAHFLFYDLLQTAGRLTCYFHEPSIFYKYSIKAGLLAAGRAMKNAEFYNSDNDGMHDIQCGISSLVDLLSNNAPPYCYFGSSSSGYGFFVSESLINNAADDGKLVKLSDVPDFENIDNEVWNGAEHALVVNDHGNMTLYNINGEELWSIV